MTVTPQRDLYSLMQTIFAAREEQFCEISRRGISNLQKVIRVSWKDGGSILK